MRNLIDKILRSAVKLCMLTGVTFLVTACYAPAPEPEIYGDDYRQDLEQLEKRLQQFHSENATEEQETL